ncbi:MAG TPA: 8-amino-7-oxononanoate synthase [Burkholderiales bacterium]|nr:8-amino-7-oxononanoate synthase [Burkholderiales bacterium]
MSLAALDRLRKQLDALNEQGLLRQRRLLQSAQGARIRFDDRPVLSFCSNDYLGLAQHPALSAAVRDALPRMGVGAGASHLITGHHSAHHEFEQAYAQFARFPAALLFSSGYMANLGIVTALAGRNGEIFADKLNHASLNDAAILSRARFSRYGHNDMAALERLLKASRAAEKIVAVDAVFSMDGDLADLPRILELCEACDAWLLVDDAHGFGVLGANGRGTLAHFGLDSQRIIYMATLGKAAGVSGAVVAAQREVIAWLVQKAKTYIYTTATPPILSAALLASLALIAAADDRRAHLRRLIAQLRQGLQSQGWTLCDSMTAIQPVITGGNAAALALSERLLAQEILVPAIRPPTVPRGSARLRISLSAAHSEADVAQLLAALAAAA